MTTTYNPVCPDCKGSRLYIGLNIVEACSYCSGTGRRPIGEFFDWVIANTDKARWDVVARALDILNKPSPEDRANTIKAAALIKRIIYES